MKTSELIAKLQELMAEYGDAVVNMEVGGFGDEIGLVAYDHDNEVVLLRDFYEL